MSPPALNFIRGKAQYAERVPTAVLSWSTRRLAILVDAPSGHADVDLAYESAAKSVRELVGPRRPPSLPGTLTSHR